MALLWCFSKLSAIFRCELSETDGLAYKRRLNVRSDTSNDAGALVCPGLRSLGRDPVKQSDDRWRSDRLWY